MGLSGKKTNFQLQGYTDIERFKTLTDPDVQINNIYATKRPWYQTSYFTQTNSLG